MYSLNVIEFIVSVHQHTCTQSRDRCRSRGECRRGDAETRGRAELETRNRAESETRGRAEPEEQRKETRAGQRCRGAKAQMCRGAKAQNRTPAEFRVKAEKSNPSQNVGEKRSI